MFMHSVYLSVCLSFGHAGTILNILCISLNLYTLFTSDIEWTVLKIIRMGLRVRLQRHTKVSRCILPYEGDIFKAYCNLFMLYEIQ